MSVVSLLLLLVNLFLLPTVAFATESVTITVDGQAVDFDVQPYIDSQSRTIVPIRFIGEQLDYVFHWDGEAKEVTVNGNGASIKIWIGQKEALVNDKKVAMDTVAVLNEGRAMVPLRFIVENMGADISYDQQTKIVNVTKVEPDLGEPIEVISEKVAVISGSVVNIRSGPGTDFPALSKASFGASFNVTARQGDWYQIALNDRTGWVAGWLVNLRDTSNNTGLPSRSEEPGERREEGLERPAPAKLNTILRVKADVEDEDVFLAVRGEEKLNYTSFRLDNPRRIVLDFPYSRLEDPDSLIDLEVNHDLVQKVRVAQFDAEQVRVVIDLAGAAGLTLVESKGDGRILEFKVGKPSIKGKTIVIDPGHGEMKSWGSSDPGATGPTGLIERDITLDISLKLARILEAKGANVILTRTGDTTLTLSGRANVANDNNADVFVSIHCNANTRSTAEGTSTYYTNNGNGQAEIRKKLASSVQAELVKATQRKNLGVLQANFAVLRYTNMPSILVETAFISNPEEEKLLANPDFRTLVAEGIGTGIELYFLD
jgi:N-acetylmuramoyl-L-alanine amidase